MMTADVLLPIIIGLLVFNFLLENVLGYLNLQYKKKAMPEDLEGIYSKEEYQKSLEYQRANTYFSFFTGSIGFVGTLILLRTYSFGAIYEWVGSFVKSPVWQGLVFFSVLLLASDLLTLPFQWYRTFVIEEKFGFNKMTPHTFWVDKLKGYLLGGLLGGVLGFVFLYMVLEIGADFWIYFWAVFFIFSLFMNIFYTSWILPLFNKLTPLEDGELRKAIEQYCQKVNFPLTNLFVIDGSKRSAKANAFFSGLGSKKKIVLYDTLIEKHNLEELVAILAHEVGHYKKNHIPVNIVLSALQIGLILFILSLFIFNPVLSQALGASSQSIPLNLMAFSFLFSPISTLTGLFFNMLSRKNEFEADRFARDTYSGKALQEALKKLSVSSLSNLTPHPIYVFFHYSHPPLLQRLRALRA